MIKEIYFDKRLEPYIGNLKIAVGKEKNLKFRKKKSWELNNLSKFIKYGIIKTDYGIYFKYNYKLDKAKHRTITQSEWDDNKISLFEKDFKSKRQFIRISFLFLNLVLKKFEKSNIKDKVLFSLTFVSEEYDNIFDDDNFINQVIFRMYGIRENEEMFDYKNLNNNKNSIGETICIVARN